MSSDSAALTGPDLTIGIPLSSIPDGGMVGGHAAGQQVLLARRGDAVFAIGATCTHYGGPLAEGVIAGETVRCPWHHACFDLRTGEPIRAPALKPVSRWQTEQRDGKVFVTTEIPVADATGYVAAGSAPRTPVPSRASRTPGAPPASIVIAGAGAAGDAAADMLRREGYTGPLTIIGADPSGPYDRPNLSKDYLAGNAPEEWIPLRTAEYFADRDIRLVTGRSIASLDPANRRVSLDDGTSLSFGALLLATGASPVRLPATVDPLGRVRYLRTLEDSRALIAAAATSKRVLILGASFIGLEVAASLRTRGLEVHVVAPEQRPLERVLGPELGEFIRELHASHGIIFHLGRTATSIERDVVTLFDGQRINADLVVAGIGVRPNDGIASLAGVPTDRGILVDEYLQRSAPGVFAAGDVARYIDARTGDRIRIEHWVVAQRMGQAVARNMLGAGERFGAVPFFWSQHYDVQISYVGHAERWDDIRIDGSIADRDCAVMYRAGGKTLAVATIGRDRASLESELTMERRTA
jgi:3-phenylpropionate/trans-cinnamate dioxygenase ferredoxin reductase subunit